MGVDCSLSVPYSSFEIMFNANECPDLYMCSRTFTQHQTDSNIAWKSYCTYNYGVVLFVLFFELVDWFCFSWCSFFVDFFHTRFGYIVHIVITFNHELLLNWKLPREKSTAETYRKKVCCWYFFRREYKSLFSISHFFPLDLFVSFRILNYRA